LRIKSHLILSSLSRVNVHPINIPFWFDLFKCKFSFFFELITINNYWCHLLALIDFSFCSWNSITRLKTMKSNVLRLISDWLVHLFLTKKLFFFRFFKLKCLVSHHFWCRMDLTLFFFIFMELRTSISASKRADLLVIDLLVFDVFGSRLIFLWRQILFIVNGGRSSRGRLAWSIAVVDVLTVGSWKVKKW